MTAISLVGSQVPAVLTVLLVIYFIVKRTWYDLALLILAVGGAQILDELVKAIVHRSRPVLPNPVLTAIGFSFPSGHAMGSFAVTFSTRKTKSHVHARIISAPTITCRLK